MLFSSSLQIIIMLIYETRCEKTGLRAFRPGLRTVQQQKMPGGLKFRIYVVEGLYYLCCKNKGADQLCVFVFAYTKTRFSNNEAHYMRRIVTKSKSVYALQ